MGNIISAILAFLIACVLVWVLKGDLKEQAKIVRNELGRKALLWTVLTIGTLVLVVVLAVNSSMNEPVEQKTKNSYYDMLERKHDCELDTRDGGGVWIIDQCFPRVDLGDLEGKYKEEWERMRN
ncbi:hypothetical protein [Bacillus mycoides]|uniref:hypothetical protein n=1 Tax=Bacillus mycoides TaxID=1405 RepID=UPI001C030CDC|nr:hypothetical protein [Bacillus mycoides]